MSREGIAAVVSFALPQVSSFPLLFLAPSVTAGILALLPEVSACSGLLIGLGGGGLVNLWHHLQTDWTVAAVELDPAVVEIAAAHFGLDCQKLDVRIGDGLGVHRLSTTVKATAEASVPTDNDALVNLGFEAESLDFIVIDVDSKDTRMGMSCPPAAFVEAAYLRTLSTLLRQGTGVLAINVSARDPLLFQNACQAVKAVFNSIFLSKGCRVKDKSEGQSEGHDEEKEDDLNIVVFGTRGHDRSLPPLREMTESATRRIQQSHGLDSPDDILLSDLCMCLEEFVVYNEDGSGKSSLDTKKTKKSNKRRNNKRGNKRR